MDVDRPPYGSLEFPSSTNRARYSRMAAAGTAMRIAPGVYVVGSQLPPAETGRHHLLAVVAHVLPGGVLCGRSALTGGLPNDGRLYVAAPPGARKASLRMPGVTVEPVVGPGPLPGDLQMPHGLWLSGNARKLVENIDVRGRRPRHRAGTEVTEDHVDSIARTGGAGAIERVLRELDVIAGSFDPQAVDAVRSRLVAVLGTATGVVRSRRLRARLTGAPFDASRIDSLRRVVAELQDIAPQHLLGGDESRQRWLAFYEAYFSNFIEGTEFDLDEARAIAINRAEAVERPADAHDVAATYRLATDAVDRCRVPADGGELIELLRDRHAVLMAARPERRPGMFKERLNFAGGYQFVEPALVPGTLTAGFDVLAEIVDPLRRAVAMMVLVTEVHPFDDGNGRVARLAANAELTRGGQVRLIIPTVYRNNYLSGLTAVSLGRPGATRSLWSILEFAQRWTAAVDWGDYDDARAQLTGCHAFLDARYAESQAVRLELPSHRPDTPPPFST